MPTTLKNGMYVTPPISNEYLTQGKNYKVYNVGNSRHSNCYFSLIGDNGDLIFSKLNQSQHINNLNWKIVEL